MAVWIPYITTDSGASHRSARHHDGAMRRRGEHGRVPGSLVYKEQGNRCLAELPLYREKLLYTNLVSRHESMEASSASSGSVLKSPMVVVARAVMLKLIIDSCLHHLQAILTGFLAGTGSLA